MKSLLKKNMKKIMLTFAGILLLVSVVFGDEIIAIVLPNASELVLISCELTENQYDYTGEEKTPEVVEAVFENEKGDIITKTAEEITIISYRDNTAFGTGDIEVKLKGFIKTAVLEDVFSIIPAAVETLETKEISEEVISLSWTSVAGAEGYQIFRKEKEESEFIMLSEIADGSVTEYNDRELSHNKIYQYKVRAFAADMEEYVVEAESDDNSKEAETATEIVTEVKEILYGAESNIVTCYTPLERPVLSKVSSQSYNTILVEWEEVEGAVGYRVFRSENAEDGFKKISEVTDVETLSYKDADCECGREYFYRVKAAQQLETEVVYGKSSNVKSSKTMPEQVKLSGKTNDSHTAVTLTWVKSGGAHGYEVYRRTENSDYKLVKKIENADTVTWSDSGLDQETKYTYRIRPYCVVNENTITGSYSATYEKKAKIVVTTTTSTSTSASSSSSKPSNSSAGTSASGSLSGVTRYTGVSYVYGGTSTSGWDCSGFTQWALRNYYGIYIPRTAAEQAASGRSVGVSNTSAWQPGDIICFSNGSRISHVGLYLGNGQMMHALNEKYDTVIQSVSYYNNWDPGNYLAKVVRYH